MFIYIKDINIDGCQFLAPENSVVVGVKTARNVIEEESSDDESVESEESNDKDEAPKENNETKEESSDNSENLSEMKYLIVGLGNLGTKYTNTRHYRFQVLDFLSNDLQAFSTDRYADVAIDSYRAKNHFIKAQHIYEFEGKVNLAKN